MVATRQVSVAEFDAFFNNAADAAVSMADLQAQLAAALTRITDLETALAEHANRIDACEMQIEGLENLSHRLEMEDGYGV